MNPIVNPSLKNNDSRRQLRAVPKNFAQYMTLDQQIVLFGLGRLGWRLNFIRRPYQQRPTIVLRSRRDNHIISVLERDGRINTAPVLDWRH